MVMAPPRSGLWVHHTYPAFDGVVAFLGIGCALPGERSAARLGGGGTVPGEHDDEGGPSARGLLDRHPTAVGLDDRVHDGQPEAVAAALAAAAGAVGAVEALEDVPALPLGYAVPVVAHVERDVPGVHPSDEDLDRGPLGGVHPRVGHEVGDDLAQLMLVRLQLGRLD